MSPAKTVCNPQNYAFGKLDRREVVANFSGGNITSDGGVVLISKVDQQFRISERLAECFVDQRDPNRVQHELSHLLAQRLYGLVQGYEDLNDHEQLRHDSLFGIAVGKLESEHPLCAPLADKSTLNRLEQAIHVEADLSGQRYIKLSLKPERINDLLVAVYLEQEPKAPKQIILDMDVSDDRIHGTQEQGFFNAYYHHACYAPLFIYCGRYPLAARLRPSNVDPAEGALEEVQRIVAQIRTRWTQTVIVVRGDSAYSRDDLMQWCEAQPNIEYILAHSSNERLRTLTWGLEQRAKAAYDKQRQQIADTLAPRLNQTDLTAELDALVPSQVWYQSLSYGTRDSWSCSRRMVCKLTYDAKGAHRHLIVTSWSTHQISPAKLHSEYYCPRGEMENRIKESQLDLFSDRTSTHEFRSNQLRLWFSTFAYLLMQLLREHGLSATELANAPVGTIRLRLLKIGAQVRLSVRRVVIALSRSWTEESLFQHVYQRLQKLPRPG